MNDFNQDLAIYKIVSLMNSYGFDTEQYSAEQLVQEWLKTYDVNWIYLATIQALYLGRYKAISIEQIMYGWTRKGQPTTHFGGDFERVICRKLPRHLSELNSWEAETKNTLNSDSKTQSSVNPQINSQPITEKNPHLTSSANPVISTQVTPFPTNKKKDASQHQFNEVIEYRSTQAKGRSLSEQTAQKKQKDGSQGIETFQPLPDASSFFQKLKAFADNQRTNIDAKKGDNLK
jgi:hypothetical protein